MTQKSRVVLNKKYPQKQQMLPKRNAAANIAQRYMDVRRLRKQVQQAESAR